MDDFSYYGTVGALTLLSFSYLWLHMDDYETMQLNADHIKEQNLVALIVNSNHRLRCQVKQQLCEKGFIVYDIYLTKEKQTNINGSSIEINPGHPQHIEEAVRFIESQLKSTNQKLHAYIDLPIENDANVSSTLLAPILLRDCLASKFNLLAALLDLIIKHGARIIHLQENASSNINLSRLVRSIERSMNQFLRLELWQLGQRLIEVNVRESDERASFLMARLRDLVNRGSEFTQKLRLAAGKQFGLGLDEEAFIISLTPGGDNGVSANTRGSAGNNVSCHPNWPNSSERARLDALIMRVIVDTVGKIHLRKRNLVI